MEKTIKRQSLPNTDSIEELARFWDTHDLTDFEADLEEAAKPVFARAKGTSLSIDVRPTEAQHLTRIARSKGVKETTVLRQWIREGFQASSGAGRELEKRMPPTRQKSAGD